MNEVLDSESHDYPIATLVEKYIAQKSNNIPINTPHFEAALRKMGKSPDQIHELLVEMDDDADKEIPAGIGLIQSRKIMIVGSLAGSLGITACIVAVRYDLGLDNFVMSIVPFGLIAFAFIAVGKAYSETRRMKKRMERRSIKYKNWS